MGDLPIGVPTNDLVLEPGQNLVLRDVSGRERLRLEAATGSVRIRAGVQGTVVRLDSSSANLLLGGSQGDGDLFLFPDGVPTQDTDLAAIHLSAGQPRVRVGTDASPGAVRVHGARQRIELLGESGTILTSGNVELRAPDGALRVRLASSGDVVAGGGGERGIVRVRNGAGDTRILLNGATADGTFGGDGAHGQVIIKDANGTVTIVLNGETANVGLGARDNAGALFIKDGSGEDAIVLNGETGNAALGRSGNGGDLFLKDDSGEDTIVIRGTTGNLGVGRPGREGNIFVKNDAGENSIHLSGQTGDILLRNADCAEDFDAEEDGVEAGDVMVIGERDALRRCRTPYDRRVAGVVSGADDYRPGIVLDRRPQPSPARVPLALVGKVFCKVDASYGPICVGDLLTSSSTPGHAMRAADHDRAFGAVIGKALGNLSSGRGMVPVLIGLQ